MGSPIEGLTVVVTRAREQIAPLRELLEQRGARVVEVPMLEIVEPADGGVARDAQLSRLGAFDWVVVTSPNGAARVSRFVSTGAPDVRIAAVGEATARALACNVHLVAEPALASTLAEQFPAGEGDVLLVQGNLADDTLMRALSDKGWTVTRIEAYRTERRRPTETETEAARSADVVLFASGSAAAAWHATMGSFVPRCSVAIGPSTARAAESLGIYVAETAHEQSLLGLVEAAERAVTSH